MQRAAAPLHIEPLLQRKPKQLSGGLLQRVAIGRAIVKQPKLFLFDEPLSNLDAKLRSECGLSTELALRKRQYRHRVTHDQVEAMTMADCIVILMDGEIEQIGIPLRFILGRPTSSWRVLSGRRK